MKIQLKFNYFSWKNWIFQRLSKIFKFLKNFLKFENEIFENDQKSSRKSGSQFKKMSHSLTFRGSLLFGGFPFFFGRRCAFGKRCVFTWMCSFCCLKNLVFFSSNWTKKNKITFELKLQLSRFRASPVCRLSHPPSVLSSLSTV